MSTVPNDIHSDNTFYGVNRFNGTTIFKAETIQGTAIDPATPVPFGAVQTKRHAQRIVDGTLPTGTTYYLLDLESVGGTVEEFRALLETIPTSTNTVSVDLEKWDGSSWASILSAAISFTSSDTTKTMKTATVATATFVSGNLFRVKIVVTGTSAAGLVAKAGFAATG